MLSTTITATTASLQSPRPRWLLVALLALTCTATIALTQARVPRWNQRPRGGSVRTPFMAATQDSSSTASQEQGEDHQGAAVVRSSSEKVVQDPSEVG